MVSVGAVFGELAADGERRVDSALLQRDHQHRRRRGLAVGAGNSDPPAVLHHAGQSLRPVEHAKSARAGCHKLDIVLTNGRRDDNRVSVTEIRRVMTDMNLGALGLQRRQDQGPLGVRPADRNSPSQHHPGDTGHARPADRDEVNRAQTAEGRHLGGEVKTAV